MIHVRQMRHGQYVEVVEVADEGGTELNYLVLYVDGVRVASGMIISDLLALVGPSMDDEDDEDVPAVRGAHQCECGAYWCTRDHDEEAARAGQTPAV